MTLKTLSDVLKSVCVLTLLKSEDRNTTFFLIQIWDKSEILNTFDVNKAYSYRVTLIITSFLLDFVFLLSSNCVIVTGIDVRNL